MPSDDVRARLSGACGLKKPGEGTAPVRIWRIYIQSPVASCGVRLNAAYVHDCTRIYAYKGLHTNPTIKGNIREG